MKLVNKKLHKGWTTPKELGALVSQSITRLKKDYPAIGWVRGDTPAGEELLIENRHLQKENESYRKRISEIESEQELDLAHGDAPLDIEFSVVYYYRSPGAINEEKSERHLVWHSSWDEIFMLCFANYKTRISKSHVSSEIVDAINNKLAKDIDEILTEMVAQNGCYGNHSEEESINNFSHVALYDDFATVNLIQLQFSVLGYIEEEYTQDARGMGVYWVLTDTGRRHLIKLSGIFQKQIASEQT
jgi:hypothetical protein